MTGSSTLRIIGGAYKGKKLNILEVEGLRPTPDRVREDIFNLIGSKVQESTVLDLFAGSGALGLESLSRGALQVTLVEKDRGNYLNLCNEKKSFDKSAAIEIVNADALKFLEGRKEGFDLVFLDPPYQSDLLDKSLELLLNRDLLKDGALVYAEYPSGSRRLFKGYEIVEKRSFSQVSFVLLKKSSFLF